MRIYLTFHVKKPTRVSVRVFMQQLEQMNTYLPYLPCLKDGDVATPKAEHINRPFSQYKLGMIVLRACPSGWEEQYYLLRQPLLTKLSPLRDVLEQIEKVQASKKRKNDAAKGGDKGSAKQKTRFASDRTKLQHR